MVNLKRSAQMGNSIIENNCPIKVVKLEGGSNDGV